MLITIAKGKKDALLLTYQDRLKFNELPESDYQTSRSTRHHLTLQLLRRNTNRLLPIHKRIKLLALPTLVPAALATIASTRPHARLRTAQVSFAVVPRSALVDDGAFDAVGAEEPAGVVAARDVVAAAFALPEGGAVAFHGDIADVVEFGLGVVGVAADERGEGGGEGEGGDEEHCCGFVMVLFWLVGGFFGRAGLYEGGSEERWWVEQ